MKCTSNAIERPNKIILPTNLSYLKYLLWVGKANPSFVLKAFTKLSAEHKKQKYKFCKMHIRSIR